jgi:hypothetical protein
MTIRFGNNKAKAHDWIEPLSLSSFVNPWQRNFGYSTEKKVFFRHHSPLFT